MCPFELLQPRSDSPGDQCGHMCRGFLGLGAWSGLDASADVGCLKFDDIAKLPSKDLSLGDILATSPEVCRCAFPGSMLSLCKTPANLMGTRQPAE